MENETCKIGTDETPTFDPLANCMPYETQCPRCSNVLNDCDHFVRDIQKLLDEPSIVMPEGLTREEMRGFILMVAEEWTPENSVEQGFKDDGYTREDYLDWISEQSRW